MKVRIFSFCILGLACGITRAQTSSASETKETVHLDAVIVTGTGDPKSVFDLAQGASVLSGEALRAREATTLGETLSSTPGVNSTYYGPGASRPIIRGLGGDRVRMLDNGVGSLDASNVSPDHNTAIEPLLVDRIEVLRGPSALLYGSSGVGGVVNVIDNRIPAAPATAGFGGRAETRYESAANERTGVFAIGGGTQRWGYQVEGLRTRTDDVKIPGFAQQGPGAPAEQPDGILPSSAISTKSGSVGGSYFGSDSYVGLAASDYETVYGVPTGDNPPTSIDLRQRRLDLRSDVNHAFGGFKGARVRFGLADYRHSELSGGTVVNTTFRNKAYEGRVELIQESVNGFSGTVGLQATRSDFSAVGDEVVTPPTLTTTQAIFGLEEYKPSSAISFQLGARVEHQTIQLGVVDPGLPEFPGFEARTGEKRSEEAVSTSAGLVYYPAKDYSIGLALASSQRAPVAQELFSNGPHGGTAAYEVGTSHLGKEKSIGLDLTLRKRAGIVTGSLSGFVNRFSGFVFEQELPVSEKPTKNNPDALAPFQFVARDAVFFGGEAEAIIHLMDTKEKRVHLDLTSDYVHAQQTTDHQPLPRIPPLRAGAELRWESGPWAVGLGVRHAFRQTRITAAETETPGYTLVGADANYTLVLKGVSYDFFVRGTNLTNEEARVHTSFLKAFAPLPGRGVTVGVRAVF